MTTHKVVPREPTAAMFIAGTKALAEADGSFARVLWYAMHDAAPAVQDAPPPRVPEFIRKRLERACDEAENAKGMSTHAGIAHVMTCDIRRLLAVLAAPAVADAPRTAATPGDPANVMRPEDGGLSEYTVEDADGMHRLTERGHDVMSRALLRSVKIKARPAPQEDAPLPPVLDQEKLRALSRTELYRVLHEFASERDAAKRSTMRAFDERNVALADLAEKGAETARLREALRSIAANGCCDRCQEAALVARRALGSEKGATE